MDRQARKKRAHRAHTKHTAMVALRVPYDVLAKIQRHAEQTQQTQTQLFLEGAQRLMAEQSG